jgi:endonuclease/exonuclease/phosphatase family metal-dependent hydrolase
VRGRRIALVLTVLATLGCSSAEQSTAGRGLSVLTFNIHHGAGPDGVVDLDRVAAEIAATGADVVGLQEVDRHYGERTGFADQPAELAARLGMEMVFAPNYVLEPLTPDAPPREHGVVILSRFPILAESRTLLPKGVPEEEQRGLLEAVIDVRGEPIRIMTTHLEADSAASRPPQARVVAAAVARSTEPVVLTGDLNGTPSAPEVTMLTALLADSGAGVGGPTFPAWAPTARIDYVLTGARGARSEALATVSSDHRPVLATSAA